MVGICLVDSDLAEIIIIALIIGLLVGYIIGRKKLNKNSHNPPKRYPNNYGSSSWHKFKRSIEKLKYTKKKGTTYGVGWFLILLSILPIIESALPKLIMDMSVIFIFISFTIGLYDAYLLTMWIDKRISNTDFGLWSRRIIAGIMAIGGFLLGLMFVMGFTVASLISMGGAKFIPATSILATEALFISFFVGLGLFAGYMEFTFERRAGALLFLGRQRF
jgi:hypothetical protein